MRKVLVPAQKLSTFFFLTSILKPYSFKGMSECVLQHKMDKMYTSAFEDVGVRGVLIIHTQNDPMASGRR